MYENHWQIHQMWCPCCDTEISSVAKPIREKGPLNHYGNKVTLVSR